MKFFSALSIYFILLPAMESPEHPTIIFLSQDRQLNNEFFMMENNFLHDVPSKSFIRQTRENFNQKCFCLEEEFLAAIPNKKDRFDFAQIIQEARETRMHYQAHIDAQLKKSRPWYKRLLCCCFFKRTKKSPLPEREQPFLVD